MPPQRMHMTTLEVAFSRTAAEAAALVDVMRPHLPRITGYTHGHRARLVKPMLSYDLAAVRPCQWWGVVGATRSASHNSPSTEPC